MPNKSQRVAYCTLHRRHEPVKVTELWKAQRLCGGVYTPTLWSDVESVPPAKRSDHSIGTLLKSVGVSIFPRRHKPPTRKRSPNHTHAACACRC